ncbi:MAG TPA: glucose-1-phosphate cytidylyltransferase [Candidatus Merdisoma merdipullorum]|nr:glucose-1-phosphate cytidylyltransferase [Candidatus Merdisoma merdipullorum]
MKVVILAGGFGTRISEESQFKPKPMIEVGGMPILWHIMKEYTRYGYREFIICAGYKQEVIKKWFADYFLYNSDVTFDFSQGNQMTVHNTYTEAWKVTVVDTGLNTMTGGRIKRVKPFLGKESFMMTYGDGVSDVNIEELVKAHRKSGRLATLTAVLPEGRFGAMDMEGDQIKSFREKSQADVGWINGGYMVLEPEVLDYIEGDGTSFEREPLERLAEEGQLTSYRHKGFWRCMDTLQDKQKLEELWHAGGAPWKTWE